MLTVGGAKQLFIDHKFIEQSQGIELVMNPPRVREIVFESENPWEAYRVLFTSIVDTSTGYRMYYEALYFDEAGRLYSNLCMAESDDGKNWQRPEAGLYEFKGSKQNNIVAPWLDGAPHYDPTSPFGKPYLMLGIVAGSLDADELKPPEEIADPTKLMRLKDPTFGMTPNLPSVLGSLDGVRWTAETGPVFGFCCDSWSNQIFYDHQIGRYVAYLRGFPGRRTVHRYETDDPRRIPWAELPPKPARDGYGCAYLTDELPIVNDIDHADLWATEPGDTDATSGDVQNPAVVPYTWAQDAYLAFPGLYRHYPGRMKPAPPDVGARHRFQFFNDGPNDIHLYVSRDGVHFSRPSRWPYLGLGLWGDYDGGCAFSGIGMVRSGDELWQYFTVERVTHGGLVPTDKNVARIMRVKQRLDGFVSADAGHLGGEFTTPVLQFQGRRLKLNIDCGALGEAWVGIQDRDGRAIPGYRLEECDPIDLNHTHIAVTWQNSADVSHLQGQPIRLRFKMHLSKLYAFQFVDSLAEQR